MARLHESERRSVTCRRATNAIGHDEASPPVRDDDADDILKRWIAAANDDYRASPRAIAICCRPFHGLDEQRTIYRGARTFQAPAHYQRSGRSDTVIGAMKLPPNMMGQYGPISLPPGRFG